MSQSLSRWQAAFLGLVVVAALAAGGVGLARVAARQGAWADTFEATVAFPDAHDVTPGTPVRVRGVDAGQVVAVEYPDHDGPGAAVTVRLRLDSKFRGRLYADAAAQVYPTGLLGSKVVAVSPGTPAAGPLADGRLAAAVTPDLMATAAKLGAVADETRKLVADARSGDGTLGKLLRDDELYGDLTGLAADTRAMVKRADVAIGTVEAEAAQARTLVQDGRETLRSVKLGTDAVQRLPVVRGYVEDAAAKLVRPTERREVHTYNTADLFEPGTAILTDGGRGHLVHIAEWLRTDPRKGEVVVAALCDPNDKGQTAASAAELTRKQSEAVVEYFHGYGAHKIGWWARRPMTAVGLGVGPSPVVERGPVPPSYLQVLLFTPQ